MRYQTESDSGGCAGAAEVKGRRAARKCGTGRSLDRLAKIYAKRTPTRQPDTATGLVIPSLAGIPLVIECDTTVERTITKLMEMGYLKPDDEAQDHYPAMAGFEAMLAQYPTLNRADEDWGDSLMISGSDDDGEDSLTARLFSRMFDQVIYIKPIIDELLKLNDPDVMNWFGCMLRDHRGLICPSYKWIEFVQELGGEPMESDSGELLPGAPDVTIDAFIAGLRSNYPYMITPSLSTTNERARDAIAAINPELAAILYSLAVSDTASFNEAAYTIGLEPNDLICHGIERCREYEAHGGCEPAEDPFYETVESLEKLPETFAKWEALLTPIDNLNTYANRLIGNTRPATDPSSPDLLVGRQ